MSDMRATFYITKTSPGCHSSSLDCREFQELFLQNQFRQVADPSEAAVIILGACIVASGTEDRTLDLVSKMKAYRDQGAVIIVSGCLTSQVKARISSVVDCVFFSVDEIDRAREFFGFSVIDNKGRKTDRSVEVLHGMIKRWQILHVILRVIWRIVHRILPNAGSMLGRFLNTTYAYSSRAYLLRCASGCSNFCSYCEIRNARGQLKSRTMVSIIDEVREALNAGYDHFVFVADDLSAYGLDQENLRLSHLLGEILSLGDSFTVELNSLHPKHVLSDIDRFLGVLSTRIRCVDLDVQSGSNRILKLMNRAYTKEEFLFLATAILKKEPSISLRTDVIVGFPSEKEEDLIETIDVLRQIPFERVGIASFEERPGAAAIHLTGQIPLLIRKKRQKKVRNFYYRKQVRRWIAGFVGKNVVF